MDGNFNFFSSLLLLSSFFVFDSIVGELRTVSGLCSSAGVIYGPKRRGGVFFYFFDTGSESRKSEARLLWIKGRLYLVWPVKVDEGMYDVLYVFLRFCPSWFIECLVSLSLYSLNTNNYFEFSFWLGLNEL